MPVTSAKRIQVAQQFIRFGFGEHIDESALFYSADFLTQELTTTEAQGVLPVVQRFNAFQGGPVAGAIARFRGRVRGWKFGRAGSPVLVAVLPYWTHQIEEMPQGAPAGRPIGEEEHQALVDELRHVFMDEVGAYRFEPHDDTDHAYAAYWG